MLFNIPQEESGVTMWYYNKTSTVTENTRFSKNRMDYLRVKKNLRKVPRVFMNIYF